jgi:hypothetical protein
MIFPYMKKLDSKRKVTFTDMDVDTFTVTLTHTSDRQPCCLASPALATYTISGLSEMMTKYNTTGKAVLHFQLDSNGLIDIIRAEAVHEFEEVVEVEKSVPDPEAEESPPGEQHQRMCQVSTPVDCGLVSSTFFRLAVLVCGLHWRTNMIANGVACDEILDCAAASDAPDQKANVSITDAQGDSSAATSNGTSASAKNATSPAAPKKPKMKRVKVPQTVCVENATLPLPALLDNTCLRL